MPDLDLVEIFIARLNKLKARYMLTGSVAATLYGEPRLTHDIDIVIELGTADLKQLPHIFPSEQFYVPPEEVLQIESRRDARGHCNIIHFESGLKADLYFMGRDPLHLWAIELRRSFKISDEEVWVAPPEYVILRKLLFYKEGRSEKHLRDIRLILEHSSSLISLPDLEVRINELGLRAEWERARNFVV